MKKIIALLIVGAAILSGCAMLPEGVAESIGIDSGGEADAESGAAAQEEFISSDSASSVMAEAVVEPARWTSIGFKGQGEVVDVLVEPGDSVAEGDLLMVLDTTDALLGVKRAEAAVANAEAQVAIMRAGARPEEVAAVEAQLEAADATVAEAAARRDDLAGGSSNADVSALQAQVAGLELQRRSAYDDYMEAVNAKCKQVQAGGAANVGGLNIGGLGGAEGQTRRVCPDETLPEQRRLELAAADAQLAAAQAQLDLVRSGADPDQLRAALAGVSSASAQRDSNQAQLDLMLAGPTPEQIAVAEAGVTQAKAALDKAKAALLFTEVRAPFDGTVVAVEADLGNMAVPGQVAAVLATLEQLKVRTTDLSELDVGSIDVGNEVLITVDAMPGEEFSGVVSHVDLQAENSRGEVTYGVTVDLSEMVAAALRWGMTAWVEFGA